MLAELALLYAFGIVLQLWAGGAGATPLAAAGAIALPLLTTRVLRLPRWRAPPWLRSLAAVTGVVASTCALARPPPIVAPEPISFEGRLERPLEVDGQGRLVLLLVASGGVRVQVHTPYDPAADWLPGDWLRVRARLHRPGGFRNPGAPDLALLARGRGVDLVAGVPDASAIVKLARPPVGWIWRGAAWLRRAGDRFVSHVLAPGRERGLLRALLLGDRREVTDDVDESFRRAGVTHVLSVSGLHLAAAAWIAYALLRRGLARWHRLAVRVEPRRVAAVLALPLVWMYTLVTGGALATGRAAVMASFTLMGVAMGRSPTAAGALACAMIVLLGCAPLSIEEPSFQLTFAAVAGLCWLAPRLRPHSPAVASRATRAGVAVLRLCGTSLAAMLATAPIAAYHFNQLPSAGLPANLVIVPLAELIVLPLGLGALALASIMPGVATVLLRASSWGCHVTLVCAGWLGGHLPAWHCGAPSPPELALFALGLTALACGRWRLVMLAATALAAAIAIGALGRARRDTMTVTFLDVGQGDAIVIELPHGHAMLVDGGGSFDPAFDPGRSVIEPFLLRRHIDRLDLVVVSHPHPDHMNGLARIIERFPVGELWQSGETSEATGYRALVAAAAAQRVRIAPPRPIQLMGVDIAVLGPRGGANLGRSTNDNSLVLKLSHGGHSLLLPGDIEQSSETELLANSSALHADVLKAPHHGSRTSSTPGFVAAVAPRVAVFTAGADNHFGFPHAEVLARYACDRLITGRDGAVTITFPAHGDLEVHSMSPPP
jgi:competence protein ComEC